MAGCADRSRGREGRAPRGAMPPRFPWRRGPRSPRRRIASGRHVITRNGRGGRWAGSRRRGRGRDTGRLSAPWGGPQRGSRRQPGVGQRAGAAARVALVACCTLTAVPQPDLQHITAADAERLVADGTLVLDVRTPAEYEELGHIPGAWLLPVDLIVSAPAVLPRRRSPSAGRVRARRPESCTPRTCWPRRRCRC